MSSGSRFDAQNIRNNYPNNPNVEKKPKIPIHRTKSIDVEKVDYLAKSDFDEMKAKVSHGRFSRANSVASAVPSVASRGSHKFYSHAGRARNQFPMLGSPLQNVQKSGVAKSGNVNDVQAHIDLLRNAPESLNSPIQEEKEPPAWHYGYE